MQKRKPILLNKTARCAPGELEDDGSDELGELRPDHGDPARVPRRRPAGCHGARAVLARQVRGMFEKHTYAKAQ